MIRPKDEEEICRRLLPIRRELRVEVLRQCGGDFIRAEKYYAELLSIEELGDLETIQGDWLAANFLKNRIYDVAKNDSYPLGADLVWQVFRNTFFGRSNLLEAEITARLLLWKLALVLESAEMSYEEEQAVVTRISNIRDLESLAAPHKYRHLTIKLLEVFNQNKGYYRRKDENVGIVNTEAWYRFRCLFRKHRSQVYSTTP